MILAIVQARVNSTRLPEKVLKMIKGKSLIEILLYRLSKSKKIDKIVLATSKNKENDKLVKIVEDLGFEVFRGSEENVLERYYHTAKYYNPDIVVRITGDCPIIDPQIVDEVIDFYEANDLDYVSNVDPPSYPDGLDTEVFSYKALETTYIEAKDSSDREHVTQFIRSNKQFKKANYLNDENFSSERWTVDDSKDLIVIKNIINHFTHNLGFSWRDVINLKISKPEYFEVNSITKRNEGAKMGTGQKLWKRAKNIIPGGNMLLSKRAENFLPDQWPTYYSKAKGCEIWDMDNNKFIDMSVMGVGTNILGYGHEGVDKAVRSVLDKGNMSTLNCPEEVFLAEKLIDLHPWADMIRFARTGGEANAIAIRIARASSGKDKVAICGYHGWHDWYLSANLSKNDELNNHLLPGLKPNGVPKELQGSIVTFNYNDFDRLQTIVTDNDIGVIKMEVSRSERPSSGFLESVRELADKNNIVLVFDECTSGFRETFGGLHKKYNVQPDMAVFGKALGNGYAITAVLGTRDVMEAAQDTFISSTFWTERIGPSAGIATLEAMEKNRSWELITQIGEKIGQRWIDLAEKYILIIKLNGLPALNSFTINSEHWIKYKTFITQEMLKKGFLATNAIYVCEEHNDKIIEKYFEQLEPIFSLISECESNNNIDEFLEVPVCHTGFKRLN